jgi:hypothetical protein
MKKIILFAMLLLAFSGSFAQMTVVGMDEKEAVKSLKQQFKDSNLKNGEKFKLEGMDAHIQEMTGDDVDIYLVMSEGLCLGCIDKITYSDGLYTALEEMMSEDRKKIDKQTWVKNDPDLDMDIYFKLFTNADQSLIYLIISPLDLVDVLYALTQ